MIIIGTFFALWLPHVFIINDSVNIAGAFEADPGGMIGDVFRQLSSYNMNDGLYSKYYGWSYFFMAFCILKPTSLLLRMLQVYSDSLLIFLIRLLNFLICLASVGALYIFLKRLFNSVFYASIGCLFYVFPVYLAQGGLSWSTSGAMQNYFYFIHPESAGFLFLFSSLWLLDVFRQNTRADKVARLYFSGVTLLALTCFSKQPFVFVAMPVYLLYLRQYARMQGESLRGFVLSKSFIVLIFKTALFCAFLFFVINPYAFLEPKTFVKNQIRLVRAFTTGEMTLSLVQAWKGYLHAIGRSVFLLTSLVITLFDIAILLIRTKRRQRQDGYFLVLLVASIIVQAILISNARFFISINYLAPAIVYSIIGDIFLIRELNHVTQPWLRRSSLVVLSCILATSFIFGAQAVVHFGFERLNYKETNFYRVYEYIKANIPSGSRVAVSHTVAIPPEKELIVFHWWLNDPLKVADFDPDFLLYQKGFSINGVVTKEAKAFDAFVIKQGYKEVADLEDISVFSRR